MQFHATLVALTLTVGGLMLLLFAFNPVIFSLVVVLGVVLLVDGIYLAGGGMLSSPDTGQKRFYFLWGAVMLIFGATLILTTTYSLFRLIPYVIGLLLLLLGIIALWGAGSR
ncbi:MAG: hypothetical protein QXX17_01420 [Conexivisphaerales archaeon]